MRKMILCSCLVLSVVAGLSQATAPLIPELAMQKPTDIFPLQADKDYTFRDGEESGRPATFTVSAVKDKPPLFTTEVFSSSSSHYNIQSVWKSSAPVKKGDVMLARFSIRSLYAKQESGEAVVYFFALRNITTFIKEMIRYFPAISKGSHRRKSNG